MKLSFNANGKWVTMAMERANVADSLQAEQQVVDTNRSLLANIRQERLAASQIRFAQSDTNTTSGTAGAMSNVQSSFAEPIEYMYRTGQRREAIQENYRLAQDYLDKYKRSVKNVQKTGAIFSTAGRIIGTAIGGPVGGEIGSFVGGAGVGVVMGADSNYYKSSLNTSLSTIGGGYGDSLIGGLQGISSATGENRTWANATNVVNWSRTQWTGETYKPVQAANWSLDLSKLSSLDLKSLGVLGGGEVQEEGGTVDRTETNIGFTQNTYTPVYNLNTMNYDYSSWGVF